MTLIVYVKNIRFYDCTTGWERRHAHGITLFYQHHTDDFLTKQRSVQLTSQISPILHLQEVTRKYLGAPFTNCVKTLEDTNGTNEHEIYDPMKCRYSQLHHKILSHWRRFLGCTKFSARRKPWASSKIIFQKIFYFDLNDIYFNNFPRQFFTRKLQNNSHIPNAVRVWSKFRKNRAKTLLNP